MKDGTTSIEEFQDSAAPVASPGYPGELKMDPQEWLPHVEKFDMTEAQKIEVLQIVWDIMAYFVRLGWDVGTVHSFIPALKEFSSAVESGNDSIKNHTQQFNGAANEDPAQKESGDGLSQES